MLTVIVSERISGIGTVHRAIVAAAANTGRRTSIARADKSDRLLQRRHEKFGVNAAVTDWSADRARRSTDTATPYSAADRRILAASGSNSDYTFVDVTLTYPID